MNYRKYFSGNTSLFDELEKMFEWKYVFIRLAVESVCVGRRLHSTGWRECLSGKTSLFDGLERVLIKCRLTLISKARADSLNNFFAPTRNNSSNLLIVDITECHARPEGPWPVGWAFGGEQGKLSLPTGK